MQCISGVNTLHNWEAPTNGTICINCEAQVTEDNAGIGIVFRVSNGNNAGIGIVFRVSNGNCITGTSLKVGACSVLIAEMMAIREVFWSLWIWTTNV